jgi:N-acetylmuramoyl-L-alanine amidase
MRCYVFNTKKLVDFIKLLRPIFFVFLVFAISFSSVSILFAENLNVIQPTNTDNQKIVIIDAGHGGEDCGTIGINGIYEKNLNFEIALLLGEMLSDNGYAVVYTRTEDKLLYKEEENIKGIRKISDLKNRCAIANEYPGAIFISIHMNSFGNPKYSGAQIYSKDDLESKKLANIIQNSIKRDVQPENNRQTKVGKDLYVLENTECTSIIVECGFLSNPEECEKLSQKEYQKQLSFAILYGIIEYSNSMNAL